VAFHSGAFPIFIEALPRLIVRHLGKNFSFHKRQHLHHLSVSGANAVRTGVYIRLTTDLAFLKFLETLRIAGVSTQRDLMAPFSHDCVLAKPGGSLVMSVAIQWKGRVDHGRRSFAAFAIHTPSYPGQPANGHVRDNGPNQALLLALFADP
jgi:hypothetical protein